MWSINFTWFYKSAGPWFQFTVSTAQILVSVVPSSIFEAFFVDIKNGSGFSIC